MADASMKELTEMQKLTSSIVKDFNSMLNGKHNLNKAIKKEVELTQDILKNLKSSADIDKAIEQIKKRQNTLDEKKFGTNQNLLIAYNAQLTASMKLLSAKKSMIAVDEKTRNVLQKVQSTVEGVTGKFKEQADSIKHQLEHIPVIGKLMSKAIPFDKITGGIDRMGNAFTGGFKGAFTKSMKSGATGFQSVMAGMRGGIAGMGTAIARLGPMLMGPQAIIAGIVAVLALGVVRMHQIEKAANEFKKSTGLLNNDTKDIQRQISGIQAQYAQIGVNADDVAGYAADFYNQFEGTQRASDAVLGSMAVLNKNFGVSVESQTKLNELFQSSAGLSQDQAQYMIGQVTAAADLANVAPNKVLKDMAENSESMYQYFHGSVDAMSQAAIQAAKLGTSISQMTKTADSLLEFESSLTSELQASAILGQNFSLSAARSAAAAGDLPRMYEEVLNSVEQVGDITKLSKFQQDAIVKATGMQISELANGISIRKKFTNASADELAAGMELLKNGKDIKDVNEEDLKNLVKKQKSQKEMQGQLHALGDMLSGFGSTILDAFLPAGQAFITIITPIVSALGGFIKGFIAPIANVFKRVSEQVSKIFDKFGGIGKASSGLSKVFEFIGTIIAGPMTFALEFLMGGISAVIDMVSGIVSIIKGIFTGDMKMIGDGIKDVFSGLLSWFLRIPIALYKAFVDMFPAIGNALTSWLSGMWDSVTSFFGFGGSDSGSAQKEASAKLEEGGSIGDGIVQKGKIITTDPADSLIAMKNPSELLESAISMTPLGMMAKGIGGLIDGIMGGGSGGGKVDLAPLITEIQGLRADLNSGKIGVSMDGRKVTAGITKISGQAAANSYVQR